MLVIDEKKVPFVQSGNIGLVKMWAESMYKLLEFLCVRTAMLGVGNE